MHLTVFLCSVFCLPYVAGRAPSTSNASTSSDVVDVKWLEGKPALNFGTTFGLPWPRGKYPSGQVAFSAATDDGEDVALQSWVTSHWADGSIKWTGHAIPGSASVPGGYKVTALKGTARRLRRGAIKVDDAQDGIVVDTGKLKASFPKSGNVLISSLSTSSGKVVSTNGKLVLQSQSGVPDTGGNSAKAEISYYQLESKINTTTVDEDSSVRTLVTVRGDHRIGDSESSATHDPWIPFTVRFYLYANSDTIRVVHTLLFDGVADKDFITGIGLRFDIPLAGEELYDRHIRIAGVDGGFLNEAVKGITGLRRDPGQAVRAAQFKGKKTPDVSTWATAVSTKLQWIPAWNDYTLTQLSPDGFTLKKRTKSGQSWVKIPGGTRAGGLAYLGGATTGGLAVGLRDFWKRYPTSIDIVNAATDSGQLTLWLYSPAGEPMDLRPFHDGLGEDTYAKQLDALDITYEDYEGGYNTPHGIGRTNEIFIRPFDSTPSSDELAALTEFINAPPVLVPQPEYIKQTGAIGTYWDVPNKTTTTQAAQTIETHLDFLNKFYQGQVEQRKWYGFWDYGDFMHTYDKDRHTWSYDIGGYAWDNSELSPDLFIWNYFLRTGRADVYRFAEAHVRHTSEVDVYHLGPYSGFGTRHGVQHWSDSAKQIRVSTPIFRQIFYYISGGDERIGELIHDLMDADKAFLIVDPRRKIRVNNGTGGTAPDPTAIDLDLGIDFSGLAAIWLIEWERRGPRWEEARSKLNATMQGIASLKNGFVTGLGLYNIYTGEVKPPLADPENQGHVEVSHLSASFGLPEIVAQITQYLGDDLPASFDEAWLDYCYYYGAGASEQTTRYGKSFGSLNLHQGHSRLTAYAAKRLGNATLAARAWNEFLKTDGFAPTAPWASVPLDGSQVLAPVDEAAWIFTNDFALYGLAAIENLAQVGDAI
ncbi:hypothetical protein E0Z10_g855 [Xylaria hypoxylon]|uniref:Tat pathway signal sequence domain protein n=1 Tax=Xylaria hypoxylon TaxID=37992 RepID=A0A4Z0ZGG3_9PEZI|nr:hypothetical protein E0Z10_g855 [Xylaria hypoxylon]